MTDPTARQKAMAEAIRTKLAELFQRPAWDAARVPDELARAADEARFVVTEVDPKRGVVTLEEKPTKKGARHGKR